MLIPYQSPNVKFNISYETSICYFEPENDVIKIQTSTVFALAYSIPNAIYSTRLLYLQKGSSIYFRAPRALHRLPSYNGK